MPHLILKSPKPLSLIEKVKLLPPLGLSAVFGSHTFCFSRPSNLHAFIPFSAGLLSLDAIDLWGQMGLCGGDEELS